MDLVFKKRTNKDKYQVRFWSTGKTYSSFVKATEKEGLLMQDVFNDFMRWFIVAKSENRLKIIEKETK